jgi:hypothetical protein
MCNKSVRSARLVKAIAIIALIAIFQYTIYKWILHDYGKYITQKCARQISLIEGVARSSEFEERDAARDLLESVLDKNLFCLALWSTDGHHVLRTVIASQDSYRTYDYVCSRPNSHSRLCYATTDSGRRCLMYEIHIPEARVWKVVQLYLSRDYLDLLMANNSDDKEPR